jgi:hypothetical protein
MLFALGAVGITTVLLLLSVLSCTMLFGAKASGTFTYPSISLIQNIKLFRNIERFDAVLVAVWVLSSFIKITLYFWASLKGLTELLKLRQPRSFIVPLALGLLVSAKYKVWGLIELAAFYDKQAWYFMVFQLALPLLLLLIAMFRKDGGKLGVSA